MLVKFYLLDYIDLICLVMFSSLSEVILCVSPPPPLFAFLYPSQVTRTLGYWDIKIPGHWDTWTLTLGHLDTRTVGMVL